MRLSLNISAKLPNVKDAHMLPGPPPAVQIISVKSFSASFLAFSITSKSENPINIVLSTFGWPWGCFKLSFKSIGNPVSGSYLNQTFVESWINFPVDGSNIWPVKKGINKIKIM